MALTLWKNSDGKLIKKSSKCLYVGDTCPCGGASYILSVYGLDTASGKEVPMSYVKFKIGNYSKTAYSETGFYTKSFQQAPWPTKEQPLSGYVEVELAGGANTVMCIIYAFPHNSQMEASDDFSIKSERPITQFGNKFTVSWRNGDQGERWYIDWTY
jgi:hypothetical protein